MGLTAVFALTACNSKGKEVKAEEFKEKSAKVEDHQYSEATIKYSYSNEYEVPNFGEMFGDLLGDDETEPSAGETGPLKESGKGEAKFTFKDGEWTTEEKELSENIIDLVGISFKDADFNVEELTAQYETMAQQYGIKSSLKFYVDPFGVELAAKGDINDEKTKSTGKLDVYEYVSFDKYGFLTKLNVKVNINSTVKVGEKDYTTKIISNIDATVSYK